MANDGSLESTANEIVGLLNSSGVANDQLDKIGETPQVQDSEQQVAEAEPELINTEQPNDSDLAVIDESNVDGEQSVSYTHLTLPTILLV